MATKHEQILQHILSLDIGHKISVRQIAKKLNVSEGTAYRAIKEAENQGIVSTIERVGTIRIEQKKKENFERLTFAEVINIVDGQVLGGHAGLHKTLNKFIIGAMKLEAMMRYTEADSLLIVGNRLKAQKLALEDGAAVLITGGFAADDEIKELADKQKLPLMSTGYDTFTVASMINRAIYDQLIKKDIVFVDDIFTPVEDAFTLHTKDTIQRWYDHNEKSTHTRFPVIDDKSRVVGMLTSKDTIGKNRGLFVERAMTRNPLVINTKTSLTYVAHMMVWEGIEVVPVVSSNQTLLGIVSRQDVLKALQQIQRQPQVGETIDDIISNNLNLITEGQEVYFETDISPQMSNQLGTLSHGVFTALVTKATSRLLLHLKKGDLVIENLTIYFIKPVQIDSHLTIKPVMLETGRVYTKVDVTVYNNDKIVGRALLLAQVIDR